MVDVAAIGAQLGAFADQLEKASAEILNARGDIQAGMQLVLDTGFGSQRIDEIDHSSQTLASAMNDLVMQAERFAVELRSRRDTLQTFTR